MTLLSITTDYCTSVGDPTPYLKLIANAGFSHLLWNHHFSDDYLYPLQEMKELHTLLKQLNLRLLDVHGSLGHQRCWCSPDEDTRRAGVELVINRAEFLTELEGEGVLIMHLPVIYSYDTAEDELKHRTAFHQFRRSMDDLLPRLEQLGVSLALENMPNDTWQLLKNALELYPAERVGLCYDSGHGNITQSCLPFLEQNRMRLRALHINDNDGVHDVHQPTGMGHVDLHRLARAIADSSYTGPMSFEITMRDTPFTLLQQDGTPAPQQPETNQAAFLKDALQRGLNFASLVTASADNHLGKAI